LSVLGDGPDKVANVIFASLQDRRGRNFLSVRDQNTQPTFRKKRLMTLMQLFIIHRYSAHAVHYVTSTDDNQAQIVKMKSMGIFSDVHTEIGEIIVAEVNKEGVAELLTPDKENLLEMIRKAPAAA